MKEIIPTKIVSEPFITPNGKRGVLIFPTDTGLLSVVEVAKLKGIRPGTLYERYRRQGWKSDGILDKKQFNRRNT